MKGYRPLDACHLGAERIQRVDCGTCPVTLACAINKGGNGFVFDCCGSTAVETMDDLGEPLLLLIDCQRHRLERRTPDDAYGQLATCPLCDGGIVDDVLLQLTTSCEWVPTVHSKVPIKTRLDVWRRTCLAALERSRGLARRKSGG